MKLRFSHFALAYVIRQGALTHGRPLTYDELQPALNTWVTESGCVAAGYTQVIRGNATFLYHAMALRELQMLADEWHCVLTPRAYKQMRLYKAWQEWPLEVMARMRGSRWCIQWKEALYAVDMGSSNCWRER